MTMESQKKLKRPEEWARQADYDIKTAAAMHEAGRYIYTIFMCHLAVEKALKALYTKLVKKSPPKSHHLLYLVEEAGIDVPEELYDFLFSLNRVSIPTRYPDDLKRMLKDYPEKTALGILKKSEEALKWLKARL
jgi:HEPN domain-containing protein